MSRGTCHDPSAALNDIIEIGDFIALDNPMRARSFIAEIEQTIFNKIAIRPRSFPARDDLAPDLRAAAHGRYLLFFRMTDEVVEIVRVFHGARDLRRMFDA
jgi:toxin ParE1/3/4